MNSGLPLDDLRGLIAQLGGPDEQAAARVREAFAKLDKPAGSLGRIETTAEWLAAWSGRTVPAVNRPVVALFAGTHGLMAKSSWPRPMTATAKQIELIAAGGGAVNQICAAYDLALKVYDLALDLPTGDITVEAALDERACAATVAFGMEATAGGIDLLCLGDVGVGNGTVAATLLAALLGGSGADWAGAVEEAPDDEADIVDAALACHGPNLSDPLEALRRVGGRELAALVGAILAARLQNIPVILDGLPAMAAATVVQAINSRGIDHCLLAQVPPGAASARVAATLRLPPLLNTDIGHGEGVGAALAAGIVKASALALTGMSAAVASR